MRDDATSDHSNPIEYLFGSVRMIDEIERGKKNIQEFWWDTFLVLRKWEWSVKVCGCVCGVMVAVREETSTHGWGWFSIDRNSDVTFPKRPSCYERTDPSTFSLTLGEWHRPPNHHVHHEFLF